MNTSRYGKLEDWYTKSLQQRDGNVVCRPSGM